MWERLTAPEDGFSKLQRENLSIIESYGKALMEVVCRDACDGHEISRVSNMQQQTDEDGFCSVLLSECLILVSSPCLSDVGSGSIGPDSVHRPSESVASLHLQQWLPAVAGGELETGRCCPAEPAHPSASPP